MAVESNDQLNFLSELFVLDAPNTSLLAEYPSSNSDETGFQNRARFIINDPFPPPRKELMKILGPHHLMCGWGQHLPVSSDIKPPQWLLDHWQRIFGPTGVPNWQSVDNVSNVITLFPHESIEASRQAVDPEVNYALHSKEIIGEIDCPQARILDEVVAPCIVKLTHGYAGLGNYFIRNDSDASKMRQELDEYWPQATLVINEVVENITHDYGVQFYLRRNGSMVWLGFTEQLFDDNVRWCGGTFSADLQTQLKDELCTIVEPVGKHLHTRGYFGLVGIDILRDHQDQLYLVDVNPRLTGISPFLMASRIFARDGLSAGIYQASCRFEGVVEDLVALAEEIQDARVLVLSGFEESDQTGKPITICHLSVSSESQATNQAILLRLLGTPAVPNSSH
ncbi:MAG: hypothetical protein ACI87E_004588 [Mariniblastus sp.]|jgi:hypothetical protein